MSTTAYTKMGFLSIIPAADLISLTSNANAAGPARVGDLGAGKHAGQLAIRAGTVGTPTTYSLVIATGDAPNAVWMDVSIIGTVYTPV